MSVELRRQSEQKRRLVTMEIRRALNLQQQYLTAYNATDAVDAPGQPPSGTGLTTDAWTLVDYSVGRLEEAGIVLPILPVGDPTHSFVSPLRAKLHQRGSADPFPPHVQSYVDASSHTRYAFSNDGKLLHPRTKLFVPGTEEFVGAAEFGEEARRNRESWAGSVVFDADTGAPTYTDGKFMATAQHVDGKTAFLSVGEIKTILYGIAKQHWNIPMDLTEVALTAQLQERMSAVTLSVSEAQKEYKHIVQESLKKLAQLIRNARFEKQPDTKKTDAFIDGQRLSYYPFSAQFETENGITPSDEEYLSLSGFALNYLLSHIPASSLPPET